VLIIKVIVVRATRTPIQSRNLANTL